MSTDPTAPPADDSELAALKEQLAAAEARAQAAEEAAATSAQTPAPVAEAPASEPSRDNLQAVLDALEKGETVADDVLQNAKDELHHLLSIQGPMGDLLAAAVDLRAL